MPLSTIFFLDFAITNFVLKPYQIFGIFLSSLHFAITNFVLKLGPLSVFYAKEKSKAEVINDINGELINLHRVIRTNPQSLSMELNSMLKSREIFEDIKFKRVKPKNNIQKAAFYFYL